MEDVKADSAEIPINCVDAACSLLNSLLKSNKKDANRKTILKSLNEAAESSNDILQDALHQIFEEQTGKIHSKPSFETVGTFMESLKCLGELPVGKRLLVDAVADIFTGVEKSLTFYISSLGSISPAELQKAYKSLLASLNVISHTFSCLKPPLDCRSSIPHLCLQFLGFTDAPLDVLIISGIVLVQALYLSNSDTLADYTAQTNVIGNLALLNGRLSVYGIKSPIDGTPDLTGFCDLGSQILELSGSGQGPKHFLLVARTFESWTSVALKELGSLSSDKAFLTEVADLFPKSFEYAWHGLDDPVDSLRHLSRRMVENLVELALSLEGFPIKQFLSKLISEAPRDSRRHFVGLSLGARYGMEEIVSWLQSNSQRLIEDVQPQQSYSSLAKECLSATLSWSSKNLDDETYSARWLQPILHAHEKSQSPHLYALVEQAVGESRGKLLPKISFQSNLRIHLTYLLVCKKSGIALDAGDEYDAVKKALTSADHQVRLNGLRLIVASPKTVEPISGQCLKLLEEYLGLNFSCHSNDMRHQFLGIAKKLVHRLAASSKSLFRTQKSRAMNATAFSSYTVFVNWLWKFCVGSVESSNFHTRCIALQVMKLLKEFFITDTEVKIQLEVLRQDVEALINVFEDSFEENKVLALAILSSLDTEYFKVENNVRALYETAMEKVTSIRPPSTLAASVLLRLLLRKGCSPADGRDSQPLSAVTDRLLDQLRNQVEVGRRSLLEAAATGPFHGVILALRSILDDPVLRPNVAGESWKKKLKMIFAICKDVTQLVLPIVASSSPEGHLPMDLEAVSLNNITAALTSNGVAVESHGLEAFPVSSQLLLVCCWRTVREVCLLIGQLLTKVSIGDVECHLVKTKEALEMGQFVLDVLLDSKHRGAFEQAAVGFTMVCTSFFRSNIPVLCQQPNLWLEEVFSDLSSTSGQTSYCSTRRSAGLPYMILAIFHGELVVSSSQLFKKATERFLVVLQEGLNEEAKIHAYNILRFIYRDTQLADSVHPFIGSGLRAAVIGSRSSTWAERNAATLMFSALMTRIFGVNRPSDPSNRSAGVTAKMFFHQHPSLFTFIFLEELQEIQKTVQLNIHPSLFPILLLLSRFQPYGGEQIGGDLVAPLVVACAGSPIMKVRELAARALPSILSPERKKIQLRVLCLTTYHTDSMNALHGLLLQIHSLLSCMALPVTESFFSHWISNASSLISSDVPADVTLAFIKILDLCSSHLPSLASLTTKLESIIFLKVQNPSTPVLQARCAELYFKLRALDKKGLIVREKVLRDLLTHRNYEVRLAAIEAASKYELSLDLALFLTEANPKSIIRWVEAMWNLRIPVNRKIFEYVWKLYKKANEELRANIVKLAGFRSDVSGNSLDFVLEALRKSNPVVVRRAAASCLESLKERGQFLSDDGSATTETVQVGFAILFYALEDDDEEITQMAARVGTSLIESALEFTLHPQICTRELIRILKDCGEVLKFVKEKMEAEMVEDLDDEQENEDTAFPKTAANLNAESNCFLHLYSPDNSEKKLPLKYK